MEIMDVNTSGMTLQNSEFRELSRNSLESAACEALERESEQRSVRQALNSKLHSNASECGEHSHKSQDNGKPTDKGSAATRVKRTFSRDMHLQHSECREHSQNSRIQESVGVAVTVSAEDAQDYSSKQRFFKTFSKLAVKRQAKRRPSKGESDFW